MYEIKHAMTQDHLRLNALYAEYHSQRAGNPSAARAVWRDFESGLRRHMSMEEALLFPVFEARTQMAAHGPTVVMRQKHGEIRRHLDTLPLLRGDDLASSAIEQSLYALMQAHDAMEEFIFTPWFDEILSEGERMILHERIRVFDLRPPENFGHG